MNIVPFAAELRPTVEESIRLYGHAPEHNVWWFEYITEKEQRPFFISWNDGTGLLAHREKTKWYVMSEPISPLERAADLICEFVLEALADQEIEKVVFELETKTRRALLHCLPQTLKARSINYTLTVPVTNMKSLDSSLSGKRWKSIRNARNTFYRENDVCKTDAGAVSKDALHKIVRSWEERRSGRDHSFGARYHALVDNNFKGTRFSRALVVNGIPVGFNAGWEIPNRDGYYYGAVGLHDYSLNDLGALLYLEDLLWIKGAGYVYADMGGGERALTHFKNQFFPEYWYKTHVFSIVKR